MDKICRKTWLNTQLCRTGKVGKRVKLHEANNRGCSSCIEKLSQCVVAVKQTASGADMTNEAGRKFAKSWTWMYASVSVYVAKQCKQGQQLMVLYLEFSPQASSAKLSTAERLASNLFRCPKCASLPVIVHYTGQTDVNSRQNISHCKQPLSLNKQSLTTA